jgi:choline dehydrogenase-like flavoprotein
MTKAIGEFDYIIVGAGSAGCVLANQLSENPANRVLLIEAGASDFSPMIHMPRGVARVLSYQKYMWYYQGQIPVNDDKVPDMWMRGRTLGGSSSINGAIYVRGQAEDYDALGDSGCEGWNWDTMHTYFRRLENQLLGEDGNRGVGGPLTVERHSTPNAVCNAFIDAAGQVGLSALEDTNCRAPEGIGYASATIDRGRRCSAATAFLKPARNRKNLTIVTRTLTEKLIFEGTRAAAVLCRQGGRQIAFKCRGEIIVSAGTIESPKLLQLSGIGPAKHLQSLDVAVVHDNPHVGSNLREHRVLPLQFHVNLPETENQQLQGLALARNVAKYLLTRRGIMGYPSYEVIGYFRALTTSQRPDAELLMAPISYTLGEGGLTLDKESGFHAMSLALRPESRGFIRIQSADSSVAPDISPNYLATENDRNVTIASYRFLQSLCQQPALRSLAIEQRNFTDVTTDDEIIDAYLRHGTPAYHAVGTCSMGEDENAVVDSRLRVKGVSGLRVVDCSVMPTILAGHTNGPAMAMAWRAADLIIEDNRQQGQ